MYSYGRVSQDFGQAVRWYTKAAEAENMDAQNNLGAMYDNGHGVPQDYMQAVTWYMKAAEAGEAKAQVKLGVMYYNGNGVPKDDVLAHMWLNLAALKTSTHVKARDALAAIMTPYQIAEAQKVAREWKPTTGITPSPQQGRGRSEPAASGTGFVVSRQGHVLTNHHVIEGCQSVHATVEGQSSNYLLPFRASLAFEMGARFDQVMVWLWLAFLCMDCWPPERMSRPGQ